MIVYPTGGIKILPLDSAISVHKSKVQQSDSRFKVLDSNYELKLNSFDDTDRFFYAIIIKITIQSNDWKFF